MKSIGIRKYCSLSLLIVCIVIFCYSLSLESLFDGARGSSIRGFDVLVTGWVGIFYGMPAWYANPLLLWSLLLSWKYPFESMACALVGLLIGATALPAHQMVLDEAGSLVPVRLEFGYYLRAHKFVIK